LTLVRSWSSPRPRAGSKGNRCSWPGLASTAKLQNGALVASVETLQPLTANFATVRVVATNAAAVAVRLRLGVLPLTLAQPLVPTSRLAGR